MDINERIALAKARINGDADTELMKQYGITIESGKYRYGEYRYEKLQDAVNYAKRNPLPAQSAATSVPETWRLPCTILGGSGWTLERGSKWTLRRGDASLELVPEKERATLRIPTADLIALEISGPGTVTSSAGLIGGGLGLEGAAIGMLIAGAINAATSRKSTDTIIRLATRNSEVFLHTSATDPAMLRLDLSPEFVQLEASRTRTGPNVVELIEAMQGLLQRGVLSQEQLSAVIACIVRVV